MPGIEPIKIEGLADFNRSLRKINSDLPKELRKALNTGAGLIVDWAAPRIPMKSGKARRSLRASSTRTAAQVTGGSFRVPYYPWLDFGGKVGRQKSVHRAYMAGGRYIYAGYDAKKTEFYEATVKGLMDLADTAGLAVDGGSS